MGVGQRRKHSVHSVWFGGQREEPVEVEGVFHRVLSPAVKVSGDATGTGCREDRHCELWVGNLLPACMHSLA